MSAGSTGRGGLGAGLLRVFLGLALLSLLAYFLAWGGNFARTVREQSQLADIQAHVAAQIERCGRPAMDGRPIAIEMLYSEGMRPWIELAGERFSRQCPNLQVKLTAMEDFVAIDGLLAGRLHPTLFAPSDELSLSYLAHRWKRLGTQLPWNLSEKWELISSPLVWLIWEDRQRVLASITGQPGEEGVWARTLCPLVPRNPDPPEPLLADLIPGTWADWYAARPVQATGGHAGKSEPAPADPSLPTMEAIAAWGRVKFGHSQPTRHAAGAATLVLLAQDPLHPAGLDRLVPSEADSLRRWLRRCEAGIEAPRPSAQALTDAMAHLGPSALDAVVTYEHLALPILMQIEASAGNLPKLAVIYPRPTLVARHPAVLLSAAPDQMEAAKRWLAFLRSPVMQEEALAFGFRPAISERPLLDDAVEQNLFLRFRRYGVRPEPHLVEAARPTGQGLEQLLGLWAAATGRD